LQVFHISFAYDTMTMCVSCQFWNISTLNLYVLHHMSLEDRKCRNLVTECFVQCGKEWRWNKTCYTKNKYLLWTVKEWK